MAKAWLTKLLVPYLKYFIFHLSQEKINHKIYVFIIVIKEKKTFEFSFMGHMKENKIKHCANIYFIINFKSVFYYGISFLL